MCDKTMENYKPNMFQLQCLKALEIQIEDGKGYNEAEIGRKMQVNLPASFFRFLLRCILFRPQSVSLMLLSIVTETYSVYNFPLFYHTLSNS